MKHLNSFLLILLRWAALSMFVMSLWAITYATVGYAMYFVLVAIFFQIEAWHHEKKEQVQA